MGKHNIYKTTVVISFLLEHYFFSSEQQKITEFCFSTPHLISMQNICKYSGAYWGFDYWNISRTSYLVFFSYLYKIRLVQPHKIATKICCTWHLVCFERVSSATIKLYMMCPYWSLPIYMSFNQCQFHQDVYSDRQFFCALYQTIEKLSSFSINFCI